MSETWRMTNYATEDSEPSYEDKIMLLQASIFDAVEELLEAHVDETEFCTQQLRGAWNEYQAFLDAEDDE